jgi:lipopolysaccharide biosynthesis regulator YciM
MRLTPSWRSWLVLPVCLSAAVWITGGCSRSSDEDALSAKSPTQAAGVLETAFKEAPEAARIAASTAAEAMREKDYEKAVVSLQTVRATENVTLEQGLAVHATILSMEGELVSAAQAGDPKAKQAYELLKALKRK